MDYYVIHGTQLNSMVETLVAVFLPLSGMWASASTNHRHAERNPRAGQVGVVPFGNHVFATTSFDNDKRKLTASVTTDTLVGDDGQSTASSPMKEKHILQPRAQQRESFMSGLEDLEMQRYGIGRNNIQVDKSYEVTEHQAPHAR